MTLKISPFAILSKAYWWFMISAKTKAKELRISPQSNKNMSKKVSWPLKLCSFKCEQNINTTVVPVVPPSSMSSRFGSVEIEGERFAHLIPPSVSDSGGRADQLTANQENHPFFNGVERRNYMKNNNHMEYSCEKETKRSCCYQHLQNATHI